MNKLPVVNKNCYSVDGLGNKFKTPVEKRAEKSKFSKLLAEMDDREIMALGYCLLISPKVKEAVDCYSQAVEHGVQLYSLEKEYAKRKRASNKMIGGTE